MISHRLGENICTVDRMMTAPPPPNVQNLTTLQGKGTLQIRLRLQTLKCEMWRLSWIIQVAQSNHMSPKRGEPFLATVKKRVDEEESERCNRERLDLLAMMWL